MLKNHLPQWQLLITFGVAPFIFFPTFSPLLTGAAWIVLIASWFIRWRITGQFIKRTPVDISLALILLLLPLSFWISIDRAESFVALNRILWGIILFYSLGLSLTRPKYLYWFLTLMVLGGGAIAGVGLIATDWNADKITFLTPYYHYLPHLSSLSGPVAGEANQPEGLFHPNIVAVALSMLIPISLTVPGLVSNKPAKVGLWLIIVFMGSVLFLTQSRLALAALLIVLWLMAVSKWRKLWILAGIALVTVGGYIIYLGPARFWNQLAEQFFGTGTGSWLGRQDVWRNAVSAIGDFPFTGIGLAVFEPASRLLYPYYRAGPGWNFRHAHDNFLQMGLDFGLAGLVAYLALLLGLAWIGFKAYRAGAGPLKNITRGILGSFGVYIGFGLFDALPFWTKPGFLPWLIFGLIVVCWQLSDSANSEL